MNPAIPSHWRCGRFDLPLQRPLVMGILNVTPDSFSDGGRYARVDRALEHAHRLIEEGADILDIGGESTRPGASAVSPAVQIERVIPVVRRCATSRSAVGGHQRAGGDARRHGPGVAIINDVRALDVPGALAQICRSDCGVVLMHMQGDAPDDAGGPGLRGRGRGAGFAVSKRSGAGRLCRRKG